MSWLMARCWFSRVRRKHGPAWTSVAEQSHEWGYYSGDPVMRWDPDGRNMTAVNRAPLYRSEGRGVGRTGWFGHRWGFHSAVTLDDYGRAI